MPPTQQYWAIVSHAVEELDPPLASPTNTFSSGGTYEEPHGSPEARCSKSVERSCGMNVDWVCTKTACGWVASTCRRLAGSCHFAFWGETRYYQACEQRCWLVVCTYGREEGEVVIFVFLPMDAWKLSRSCHVGFGKEQKLPPSVPRLRHASVGLWLVDLSLPDAGPTLSADLK